MVYFYQLCLITDDVILTVYTSLCQKAKCTLEHCSSYPLWYPETPTKTKVSFRAGRLHGSCSLKQAAVAVSSSRLVQQTNLVDT